MNQREFFMLAIAFFVGYLFHSFMNKPQWCSQWCGTKVIEGYGCGTPCSAKEPCPEGHSCVKGVCEEN